MTSPAAGGEWKHRTLDVGEVRMHCVEAGAGPLVVLLHGFPEFWYSWRQQIPPLVEAGFRVVAPDLRGYGRSDRPAGVRAYRVDALVGDVAGLVRALGEARAHVVGHDWGGMVAWYMAMLEPARVDRLVVINAPHPAAYRRELFRSTQWLRSWYAALFQLPVLPETLLRAGGFAAVRRLFRTDPVRPDAFTDADIDRYVDALAEPGALNAALNYYRALMRYPPRISPRRTHRVRAPTLLIWGEQDSALVGSLAEGLDAWVDDIRVERLPGVSHWVQADAPDHLNRLLLEFLAAS